MNESAHIVNDLLKKISEEIKNLRQETQYIKIYLDLQSKPENLENFIERSRREIKDGSFRLIRNNNDEKRLLKDLTKREIG